MLSKVVNETDVRDHKRPALITPNFRNQATAAESDSFVMRIVIIAGFTPSRVISLIVKILQFV